MAGRALDGGWESARALVAAGRWADALAVLRGTEEAGEITAAGLELLAETAWLCADREASLAARERAYQRYLEAGDEAGAGRAALLVSFDHLDSNDRAQATGWRARAERHLERAGECAGQGYLMWFRASAALGQADYDVAEAHAAAALEVALQFGDADLEALATWYRGYARVGQADAEGGFALMDEALAAAAGGGVGAYMGGFLFCVMVTACRQLGDMRRAAEWVESQQRWCADTQVGVYPSLCRVNVASVLCAQGTWEEAERAAADACRELEPLRVPLQLADAYRALGEVLHRRGDDAGAERAFLRAAELGLDPQPAHVILLLAQGRVAEAREMVATALDQTPDRDVQAAWLHAAGVKAALLDGDTPAAEESLARLEELAARFPHPLQAAEVSEARGLVGAGRDPEVAASDLRRAVVLWRDEVRDPYRAAQARVALAGVLDTAGRPDQGRRELAAARAAFAELRAGRDLALVDSLVAAESTPAARSVLMFTDIVGSTPLVEAIGDDAWAKLLAWHDRTLRAVFAARGGREVDHAGDGFFVAFADPAEAVAAAVDIQRSLAAHRGEHGFAPALRIGLHACDVQADGAALRGRGVHLTARLAAAAGAGEILVSGDVADALPALPRGEERTLHLAGIADPVSAVTVRWLPARA